MWFEGLPQDKVGRVLQAILPEPTEAEPGFRPPQLDKKLERLAHPAPPLTLFVCALLPYGLMPKLFFMEMFISWIWTCMGTECALVLCWNYIIMHAAFGGAAVVHLVQRFSTWVPRVC